MSQLDFLKNVNLLQISDPQLAALLRKEFKEHKFMPRELTLFEAVVLARLIRRAFAEGMQRGRALSS